jgi:hypothetical protein
MRPLISAGMKTVALLVLMACAAPGFVRAESTEIEVVADPRVYGDYPKNYQEIITKWLNDTLDDAPSAQIEWVAAPRAGSLPEKKNGKALFGYLVEFKVNSRNRFGAYTGMQKHNVLIRDGQVIKATGFGF